MHVSIGESPGQRECAPRRSGGHQQSPSCLATGEGSYPGQVPIAHIHGAAVSGHGREESGVGVSEGADRWWKESQHVVT